MRKVLGISLALVVALTTMASGKPAVRSSDFRPEVPDLGIEARTSGLNSLSSHIFGDTVGYGGTVWASDSLRWEAIRDSHWSFDTGVGSSINTGANPNKPVGYHQTFEGWFGIDQTLNPLPYFRRNSTCAISGSFSLWAGVTLSEANTLCYVAGQGYGNSWTLTVSKTFAYPGAGNVSFSYDYAVDSEPLFDFAYVMIDTTGDGSADDLELAVYDDIVSGTESITLNPGSDMRSNAGDFTLKFVAASDGGYSDEDGLYGSTCGLMVVDDVTLSGAVTDFTDFEADLNGWAQETPVTGIGLRSRGLGPRLLRRARGAPAGSGQRRGVALDRPPRGWRCRPPREAHALRRVCRNAAGELHFRPAPRSVLPVHLPGHRPPHHVAVPGSERHLLLR
jgi:hypothetical protein